MCKPVCVCVVVCQWVYYFPFPSHLCVQCLLSAPHSDRNASAVPLQHKPVTKNKNEAKFDVHSSRWRLQISRNAAECCGWNPSTPDQADNGHIHTVRSALPAYHPSSQRISGGMMLRGCSRASTLSQHSAGH